MFALVHNDKHYYERIAKATEGIFTITQVHSMSELQRLGALEGIFADARLAKAIEEKMPGVPVMAIEEPFMVSEALRWWDSAQKPPAPMPQYMTTGVGIAPVSMPNIEVMGGRRGKIILFVSPKGGSGRTTLSSHMAAFGASQGKKVVFIDADDDKGDAVAKFGLDAEYTDYRGWRGSRFEDAIQDGLAITPPEFPSLYIVPGPKAIHGGAVTNLGEDVAYLTNLATQYADVVLIDSVQGWNPLQVQLLPLVSHVVVVVAPKVGQEENAQLLISKLIYAQLQPSQVSILINHPDGNFDWKQYEHILSPFPVTFRVPFDRAYKRKGGVKAKKIIRASLTWWKEQYGFPVKVTTKSRWRR